MTLFIVTSITSNRVNIWQQENASTETVVTGIKNTEIGYKKII